MSKRKTRKQKENVHHPFLVSWKPQEARVKGESHQPNNYSQSESKHTKRADILAQDELIESSKKGMLKSLMVASLILILEVVIYLAWSK